MIKRLLMAGFSILALTLSAVGGDRAQFDAIGYSADGRYFAFEEFGLHDGSGFAYASVHLIDLLTNKAVGGSPFLAQATDEHTILNDTRNAVRSLAETAMADHMITTQARIVAHRADGEADYKSMSLSFSTMAHFTMSSTWRDHELIAQAIQVPSLGNCGEYDDEPIVGLRLIYVGYDEKWDIFVDKELPGTRGCPIGYNPTAVFIPFDAEDIAHGVVLISVWTRGFEGPDRRFMALAISNGE